jgi:hypothetical protein
VRELERLAARLVRGGGTSSGMPITASGATMSNQEDRHVGSHPRCGVPPRWPARHGWDVRDLVIHIAVKVKL